VQDQIEPYQYEQGPLSQMPAWSGLAHLDSLDPLMPATSNRSTYRNAPDQESQDLLEQRIGEERRRIFEEGRRLGQEEGRADEHKKLAAAQTEEQRRSTARISVWLSDLATERDRYLRAVEHEVVELALAVAARILRREAQMDPLLLTGAVRVALGQLARTTSVRLYVPEPELELWKEAMAHAPNLPIHPEVLAGEGMEAGDCAIKSEVGSVDLGIRAQLREIERGFFDRVASKESPAIKVANEGSTIESEATP
jgi:flagellar biosynthesis/type III secretory pathway protein FliH